MFLVVPREFLYWSGLFNYFGLTADEVGSRHRIAYVVSAFLPETGFVVDYDEVSVR